MVDEHFMRQWNSGHLEFSADLDRALAGIGKAFRAPFGTIGVAYASLLSGLAAAASTTVLFVTIGLLASLTPDHRPAPHATFALTPTVELA